eukprot:TRINITY_DN644_c0_g1_i1.p1 TRINITY_DN644_c0_g1~~TRINITY_DN644_c0_g1_i1.p1  ORF type:complete len:624 (+),score=106.69 TRINITY_DN644_c0_g1_i1:127-1998(+)
MEDFLPLMHQLESDVLELERVIQVEYSQALTNMRLTSKFWYFNRVEKGLVDYTYFSTKYERLEINTDKLLLSEIILKIQTLMKRAKENIPVISAGGITEAEFVQQFGTSKSVSLFAKQLAFEQHRLVKGSSSSFPDPYLPYHEIIKEIYGQIDIADLVQVVHSHVPKELAETLFELSKGIPVKEIPSDANVSNWPGIENCLKTIHALKARLEKEKKSTCSMFSQNEIDYVLSKLNYVQVVTFNSKEIRLSKKHKVVRNLDMDLAPYIPKPEKLLAEFLSPTDYVMNSFRNVIKLMGYDILHIEGDGNCFFRATVKTLFPTIPRNWEDSLSTMVRKSLNRGLAQRAKETGQEYPYQGFVIDNVNDSMTMAKVGVWADHIQVQKLAAVLERPIWLILYDDIQLQRDMDGNLIPGRDYNIGNGKGEPLVLFFTPSPGHYESIVNKDRPKNNLTVNEQLTEIEKTHAQHRTDIENISPVPICNAFFQIAEEVQCLEQISKNFAKDTPDELMPVVLMDIQERATRLFDHMRRFWCVLSQITARYLAVRQLAREFIYLDILSNIFKDAIVWSENQVITVGFGPLSELYTTTIKAVQSSNLVANAGHSQPPPSIGAWPNQQQPVQIWNWF